MSPTNAPTAEPRGPTRVVHVADALDWLPGHLPVAGASVITSLPDISGLGGMTLPEYRTWFIDAAKLVLAAADPAGVAIFYQTDIKVGGTWLDKGYLCQRAAELVGCELLWHRIVCRKPIGSPNFGRPGYTHLLCFSAVARDSAPPGYPDVLPSTGTMTWSQAMGRAACELACQYVLSHTHTRLVLDPFCGHGSVLAVANAMNLDAIGIELSAGRARKARRLTIDQFAASSNQ